MRHFGMAKPSLPHLNMLGRAQVPTPFFVWLEAPPRSPLGPDLVIRLWGSTPHCPGVTRGPTLALTGTALVLMGAWMGDSSLSIEGGPPPCSTMGPFCNLKIESGSALFFELFPAPGSRVGNQWFPHPTQSPHLCLRSVSPLSGAA